jgi:hypothetical protein
MSVNAKDSLAGNKKKGITNFIVIPLQKKTKMS